MRLKLWSYGYKNNIRTCNGRGGVDVGRVHLYTMYYADGAIMHVVLVLCEMRWWLNHYVWWIWLEASGEALVRTMNLKV